MYKETKRIIIPILVITLFFTLALSPAITADNDTFKDRQLNVLMQDMPKIDQKFIKKVSREQLEEVNDSVNDFIMLVDSSMDENSPAGNDITVSEWEVIKTKIYGLIDLVSVFLGEDFPTEDIKIFVNSVITTIIQNRYFLRQPIISIGIGITWIPFYDYETMIGKLIKPIFIHHLLGFSATFKLFPFAHGFPTIKYGLHRMRTFFFTGLLIDFSDLGYNRIIGPQILIGFGVFTGFS
jgi:hypothetical protein